MKEPGERTLLKFVRSELDSLRRDFGRLWGLQEGVRRGEPDRVLGEINDFYHSITERMKKAQSLLGEMQGKPKCIIHDYHPIAGLYYTRKNGQKVERQRCSKCNHTISEDRLPGFKLDPYKQAVFIILKLEGMKTSELLELFPKEEADLYYWWRKCRSMKVKELVSLKPNESQTTTPLHVRSKKLFMAGRTYQLSLVDSPSTKSESGINIIYKTKFNSRTHVRLTEIRAIQFLLLGATPTQISQFFGFGSAVFILDSNLSEFNPLPYKPYITENYVGGFRNWQRPFRFSLSITSEQNPNTDSPLRIEGKTSHKKPSLFV